MQKLTQRILSSLGAVSEREEKRIDDGKERFCFASSTLFNMCFLIKRRGCVGDGAATFSLFLLVAAARTFGPVELEWHSITVKHKKLLNRDEQQEKNKWHSKKNERQGDFRS